MADLSEVSKLLDKTLAKHTRALRSDLDILRRDTDTAYEEFGPEAEIYQTVFGEYLTTLELAYQIRIYLESLITDED